MRKNAKTEAKNFFFGCLYASVFLEAVNILADWYTYASPDHAWPWIVGTGLVAFGRYCNHYLGRKRSITLGQSEGKRKVLINGFPAFLSSVPLIARLGPDLEPHKPEDARIIKYREPRQIEYFWDVPLPNREVDIRVYESRLLVLCEVAYRRQRSDLLPEHRYPFSRNFFTKQLRPRYPMPLYAACLTILADCDLLDGRSQGASGGLRYRPTRTVALAKHRFTY